eukprot:TRINITY_DN2205_c1_g1_i1.p1 TRINITY_DN2205_c1_g1~~TRINITY_DN2205_c1_g1_i1.p1  ORF type:complete len:614 (+),score=188.15 TRINITY_DN2205_c1_g1_i1:367-2208(+)
MGDRLKDRTKKRIIEEMIRSVRPSSGWKVLIVDHASTRIISSACRMFDIMEEGVSLVENIAIKRQPLPNMDAIYFLSSSAESIQHLLDDFQNDDPMYGHVHLFFINAISNDELKKIKANTVLLPRIKKLVELNIDFLAYEQQAFHFDSPNSFHTLFSPDVPSRGPELKAIVEKLACVCATLNEYPFIRYSSSKDATGGLTRTIADLLQNKLDDLMKSSKDYASKANITTNRATLLIVDRAMDPIIPILHEFTYQAMIYDILSIENDRYSFNTTTNEGVTKKKEVILGESDPLWNTVRHMHIAELMTWLLDNFNDFVKENKASKISGGKVQNLKEMGEAMKAMPQFQEMLSKYSLHINMTSTAMGIFEEQQLAKIAGLEQDMATGEDANDKPIKNVVGSIAALLQDPKIEHQNKIRLLMLFIISQEGIKESDRKRLMDLTKASFEDHDLISNLRYLGVTLLKSTKGAPKKRQSRDKNKQRTDAPGYDLSRYIPNLKGLVESTIDNSLSATDYPFTSEPSSSDAKVGASNLRKTVQPKWADKETRKSEKGSATTNTVGGRIIVFIAGGMTYAEMRTVYELTQKHSREVVIGSTSILTPKTFMEELQGLKRTERAE